MSGSDSDTYNTDFDKVRFRAVFVPDGVAVDGSLLEGMCDTVMVRAQFIPDDDGDPDGGASPATGSPTATSGDSGSSDKDSAGD